MVVQSQDSLTEFLFKQTNILLISFFITLTTFLAVVARLSVILGDFLRLIHRLPPPERDHFVGLEHVLRDIGLPVVKLARVISLIAVIKKQVSD